MAQVQEVFQDKIEDYHRFMQLLRDYNNRRRTDIQGVTTEVKENFEGHDHLILGFNEFLPPQYQIQLPVEENQEQRDFQEALNFVRGVKVRLEVESRYGFGKSIREKVKLWRMGKISRPEVFHQVVPILRGHEDLVEEFISYFSEIVNYPSWGRKRPRSSIHHSLTTQPKLDLDYIRFQSNPNPNQARNNVPSSHIQQLLHLLPEAPPRCRPARCSTLPPCKVFHVAVSSCTFLYHDAAGPCPQFFSLFQSQNPFSPPLLSLSIILFATNTETLLLY
ncbi:Paired amphipathic helix protein-like [Arachis hypogaea]|uniref:Paired amphipathic helix protein Sin3-like n=1 Tax=Arachis hypogaea TaxID=3818 RepID=A0A444ZV84_ARAHY|nr:Paired amphipathic helix protein-like [Arachis hypogaea]RYR18046.1 hypothetical protein Ahy_B03g062677 [Arachis hypogaea]